MKSCSFLAPFWPPYGAMAPLWHPLGRLVESFWLAFSAFERLEPQREPFQPRFYDLVSFLVPCRSNFVKSLRFLTELLKVVWFLSVYTFSSPCSPSYPSSPSFPASCLLATSGVRAQRSGARPLLAGCLDGCLDGWLDGLLDGCPLPLLHFIVLSVFACSGFERFLVVFGIPFEKLFESLGPKLVFFFMLVSRSFF